MALQGQGTALDESAPKSLAAKQLPLTQLRTEMAALAIKLRRGEPLSLDERQRFVTLLGR